MTLETVPTPGHTSWFTHDRFGLFIHWGLYALGARHEWLKNREKMDDARYQRYFDHFDPDLYDPKIWAEAASKAGMKYFVVTSKHHEGFCLWDTKLTDYNATNTPYGRDLLKPMVDAFREQDMKVGFYHSLLDWHHPEYTVDGVHPQRRDRAEIEKNKNRDMSQYVDFLHGQTRELLSKFGKIDVMWFDFSFGDMGEFKGKGKNVWRSEELIQMVRELQPGILLNDRLGIDQDIKTPEQFMPRQWVRVGGQPVIWEACHTFSGSWGYHRDEASWKSLDQLVKLLVECVSKGGNLLLNVGPTGRGEFDQRVLERLEGLGMWMHKHERSIYGCTQAPEDWACPEGCRYTYNPKTNRLYVHLFSWPFRHLHLPQMASRVKYAQLLNDASEIQMLKPVHEAESGSMKASKEKDLLTFDLPVHKPDVIVPVIELFLE